MGSHVNTACCLAANHTQAVFFGGGRPRPRPCFWPGTRFSGPQAQPEPSSTGSAPPTAWGPRSTSGQRHLPPLKRSRASGSWRLLSDHNTCARASVKPQLDSSQMPPDPWCKHRASQITLPISIGEILRPWPEKDPSPRGYQHLCLQLMRQTPGEMQAAAHCGRTTLLSLPSLPRPLCLHVSMIVEC